MRHRRLRCNGEGRGVRSDLRVENRDSEVLSGGSCEVRGRQCCVSEGHQGTSAGLFLAVCAKDGVREPGSRAEGVAARTPTSLGFRYSPAILKLRVGEPYWRAMLFRNRSRRKGKKPNQTNKPTYPPPKTPKPTCGSMR